jgi:ribonuclease D
VPRSRVFKDDALLELASTRPQTHEDLGRSRLLLREARRGEIADGILAAVKAGLEAKPEDLPKPVQEGGNGQSDNALSELLRVLLKARAEAAGVAQKLIATSSDLDAIASGSREVPALSGWRREVFGEDALRLCAGQIALSARGGAIAVIPV